MTTKALGESEHQGDERVTVGPEVLPRKKVISIHGMFTVGRWQKDIQSEFNENNLEHSPLDYGFYMPWRFLSKESRHKKIDWFFRKYEEESPDKKNPVSCVCHSMGSYIVANALLVESSLRIDRLYMCGTFLDENYPWDKVFEEKKVNSLFHHIACKDIPVRLARVYSETGRSYLGFKSNHEKIEELKEKNWGHSGFFISKDDRKVMFNFLRKP